MGLGDGIFNHQKRHPRESGDRFTPRPLNSITDVSGILDPRLRGDNVLDVTLRSRGAIASEVCIVRSPPLKVRGRREDRVRAAPAVSCAKCAKRCAHEHTGSAGASRPSLRSGSTAYSVLSPVNGSFSAVVRRSLLQANLTPAPRRQDHTTSPYAIRPHSSVMALASTASHRAFVTMANAPHLP